MKTEEFDVFKIFFVLKKQYKALFLFSILFGVLLFLYFQFIVTPTYKANFTAQSTVLEARAIITQIENLQSNISNKDYLSLAQTLNIDEESAKKYTLFEAKEVKDKQSKLLKVTILAKSDTLIETFPSNFENFLNNDAYFSKLITNYKAHLEYETKKLNFELDSLQKLTTQEGFTVINNLRNIESLMDKKLENLDEIETFSAFSVLGNLGISTDESSIIKKVVGAIAGGIASSVILVLALQFLAFLRDRVAEYEN